ncbi:MAG: right-handed parallel beta-helix repeat-containing protein [Pyrinomonadaceae bacterium]|nr:right-handed parallel beta-helix repeat-containing protein [Pyrinomonadaceae bacterium]
MNHKLLIRIVGISIFLVSASIFAEAQATRTWISGVGDDVNPCSRTAPCKTFAGAISKTATNGEINCLDPGGFGAVTITKSITLDCKDTQGGVLASSVTGIIINITNAADTRKVVNIRGLNIDGVSNGLNGIRIVEANRVVVEDTIIDGFTQNGVSIENSVNLGTQVVVSRTSIRNVVGTAISATSSGTSQVMVSDSLITGNGIGVSVSGESTVRISGNVITNNQTGLLRTLRGAQIISFLNNVIDGNGTNGTPSSTVALQ